MTAPRPLPRTAYPKDRAAIAAGYRHLADLIESGQTPIPMNISVSIPIARDENTDQAAVAAELRQAFGGGRWDKHEAGSGTYLVLDGMCGGLPISLWMDRDAVCERVVVGTETVEVPAVNLPAYTETREIVEWRCAPLLAAAESAETVEVTA